MNWKTFACRLNFWTNIVQLKLILDPISPIQRKKRYTITSYQYQCPHATFNYQRIAQFWFWYAHKLLHATIFSGGPTSTIHWYNSLQVMQSLKAVNAMLLPPWLSYKVKDHSYQGDKGPPPCLQSHHNLPLAALTFHYFVTWDTSLHP